MSEAVKDEEAQRSEPQALQVTEACEISSQPVPGQTEGSLKPLPAWQGQENRQNTSPHPILESTGSTVSRASRGTKRSGGNGFGSSWRNPFGSHEPRSPHQGGGESISPKLLADRPSERPRQPRQRHTMDWLLGSRTGQYTIVLVLGFLLLICSSLAWFLVPSVSTETFPGTFKSCVWIAYALIFDPGTQTGLWGSEADTKGETLWVAGMISVLGFVYMLVWLGMVVESIRHALQSLLKSRSRINTSDHILILGWTDKTVYLLKEMLHEAGSHRQNVIILSTCEEMEMKSAVDDHMPKRAKNHIVRYRKGCPYDANELLRVNVGTASNIIVLGKLGPPRDSDLEVVRVVLGLAALEPANGHPALSAHSRVIAEVKCPDTGPVLEALLLQDGPQVEGIHARSTVNRMLCLMAVKPVLGDALASLSRFDYGEELYCIKVPFYLEGGTFKDACEAFGSKKALCIGIKPMDKPNTLPEKVILAPPDDRVIGKNDRLLLIAENEGDITARQPKARRENGSTRAFGRLPSLAPARCQKSRTLFTGQADHDEWVQSKAPPIVANVLEQDRSGKVYVIVGWPDDFLDLIMTLDLYVRKGTEVFVLTSRSDEERLRIKASPSWRPKNITLLEQRGCVTNVDRLTQLPLADAHSILVLSEEHKPCASADDAAAAMSCDSVTVTVAVMIHGICEGKYGATNRGKVTRKGMEGLQVMEGEENKQLLVKRSTEEQRTPQQFRSLFETQGTVLSGRIICEVLDPRTDRMVNRNRQLQNKITFFKSNALETGLFAMARSEPTIFNTLVLLLSPGHEIGVLRQKPVSEYSGESPGTVGDTVVSLSFWQLYEMIRAKEGDLLVGWYRLDDGNPAGPEQPSWMMGGRLVMGCEVDKSQVLDFTAKDRLVVLQRPREGQVARALQASPTERRDHLEPPGAASRTRSTLEAALLPTADASVPALPALTPTGIAPSATLSSFSTSTVKWSSDEAQIPELPPGAVPPSLPAADAAEPDEPISRPIRETLEPPTEVAIANPLTVVSCSSGDVKEGRDTVT